jgi:hypothetical protein
VNNPAPTSLPSAALIQQATDILQTSPLHGTGFSATSSYDCGR